MSDEVWQVFVPHLLLQKEPSFLCGTISPGTRSVYITASSLVQSDVKHPPSGIDFIGHWNIDESPPRPRKANMPNEFVDIRSDSVGDVNCVVYERNKCRQCTVIVYNPYDLLKSDILTSKITNPEIHNYSKTDEVFDKSCNASKTLRNLDDKSCAPEAIGKDEPDKDVVQNGAVLDLLNILHKTNHIFHDLQNSKFTLYTVLPSNRHFGQKVMSVAVFFVTLLYLPFKWIKTDSACNNQSKSLIKNAIGYPSTYAQLGGRQKLLKRLKSKDFWMPEEKLRTTNVCVIQLMDTFMGLLLMYVLIRNNTAQNLADICLAYGDHIANELKVLLDWLMGAPAGLKLNSQLTHILGKFFLYHIYLWSGYLVVLKPLLGPLVYICSLAGVWGVSTQLALFQDILSTMTIHIYCFYVYAARLYRLQMYALASLWRLFRGKKWNVLRERVDSAIYDVDQLFVGTLLFTVLLFILPTTGLYYIVFTLLRVFVLLVQGMVSRLRHHLNTIPWWCIIMWLRNSPSLTNGAVFHFKSYTSNRDSSTLVLSMQATRPSLNEIMTISKPSRVSTYSWGTIMKNLFLGHLIYPWIERKHKEF